MAKAAAIKEPNLPWADHSEDRGFKWLMIIMLLLFLGAGVVLNLIKLPEIEQKNLQHNPVTAERGTRADIGDAVPPLFPGAVFDQGSDRVDAVDRADIPAEMDVGGGKTQIMAATFAVGDTARQLEIPAKNFRRSRKVGVLEPFAHAGR